MGIQFTLSDREFPASTSFVSFLDGELFGRRKDSYHWHDQRNERLARPVAAVDPLRVAAASVEKIMGTAQGRRCVQRAYELFVALLVGDPRPLREWQARHHVICVVGIPRTGGSYLTAEAYRSLGIDPAQVAGALAHDSFPDAGPFELAEGSNSWVNTLKTAAEYLAMTEFFFAETPRRGGAVVVPKKLTQAAYAGGFFRALFGSQAEYIVTVRHPVAACVSTYEKSGGLPAGGRFAVRSNIEAWCRRDAGIAEAGLELDYFEVYLRYWERYHLRLAAGGLFSGPRLRIVPFGAATTTAVARSFHERHASGALANDFAVAGDACARHPEWAARAEAAIARVAAAWQAAGLAFPSAEVMCGA